MSVREAEEARRDAEAAPEDVYARRLAQLNRAQGADQLYERRLGLIKLAVAAVTLIAAVLSLHYLKGFAALPLLAGVFIVLAVLQEKRIRGIRLRARAISFFERGVARVEGRWAGAGESGERFLSADHPYARDLDIFGSGSLFQLICTARTRSGEETLAAWLLSSASIEEVSLRQQAVRELKADVGFRERLSSLGDSLRAGIRPDALVSWGKAEPIFDSLVTRVITRTLGLMWILSIVVWIIYGAGAIAAAVTILNLAWSHRIYRRLDQAADSLEKAADDLTLLSGVLSLIENEAWTSSRLIELQSKLKREGVSPSAAVGKLARIVEIEKSRHNPIGRLLGIFTFWNAQLIFTAEIWQRQFGPFIEGWLLSVGEMEALTALSCYAFEHPGDPFPELEAANDVRKGTFDAVGLAHPLMSAKESARNDVRLDESQQLIILSGPNMAGKSTFIRSIGVNAVLAQCGAPVRAMRLRLSPLKVAASICILDSLSGGVSRFYAEIRRVKQIFDLASGPVPVLFLLDELLSGTNSHDRLAGSEFIVRGLIARNSIGVVSTHDLALTTIPNSPGMSAVNFHFEDRVEDGRLIFDYKLKPGVVETSSALELMRSIGLGVE